MMYRDEILDFYRNPRNSGKIEEADRELSGENTSCGDHVDLYLKIEDGRIRKLKHESEACAICTAATSILTEEVRGLDIEKVKELDRDWMLEKLGIEVSPMRIKCAMLGLETLQEGLE